MEMLTSCRFINKPPRDKTREMQSTKQLLTAKLVVLLDAPRQDYADFDIHYCLRIVSICWLAM